MEDSSGSYIATGMKGEGLREIAPDTGGTSKSAAPGCPGRYTLFHLAHYVPSVNEMDERAQCPSERLGSLGRIYGAL